MVVKVCSLLWMHIQEMSGTIKKLHIFSDACRGQNCNLVRFLPALTILIQSINIFLFVGTPSFNATGTLALLNVRSEKFTEYTPGNYNELIQTAREVNYSVTKMMSEHILNYKNWW